jgi:predicted transposase YdaD
MFEITLQETRVYREAKEEGLKQALEEIREKGREQGIQEGREQAKRELIPRFLAYGIPIEEVARQYCSVKENRRLGFVPQPNLHGLRFLGKTYAVLGCEDA